MRLRFLAPKTIALIDSGTRNFRCWPCTFAVRVTPQRGHAPRQWCESCKILAFVNSDEWVGHVHCLCSLRLSFAEGQIPRRAARNPIGMLATPQKKNGKHELTANAEAVMTHLGLVCSIAKAPSGADTFASPDCFALLPVLQTGAQH